MKNNNKVNKSIRLENLLKVHFLIEKVSFSFVFFLSPLITTMKPMLVFFDTLFQNMFHAPMNEQ